jgi:hypothetical protein
VRRAIIVVLIPVLIASVSGIDERSAVFAEQPAQASDSHQQEISSRAARIGIGRVIRIERTDRSRLVAVLEEVMPDSLTVIILTKQERRQETIPLAEIRKIEEVRGHALRNVLIGVGIGVGVLVGTCFAALSSETSPVIGP